MPKEMVSIMPILSTYDIHNDINCHIQMLLSTIVLRSISFVYDFIPAVPMSASSESNFNEMIA